MRVFLRDAEQEGSENPDEKRAVVRFDVSNVGEEL